MRNNRAVGGSELGPPVESPSQKEIIGQGSQKGEATAQGERPFIGTCIAVQVLSALCSSTVTLL